MSKIRCSMYEYLIRNAAQVRKYAEWLRNQGDGASGGDYLLQDLPGTHLYGVTPSVLNDISEEKVLCSSPAEFYKLMPFSNVFFELPEGYEFQTVDNGLGIKSTWDLRAIHLLKGNFEGLYRMNNSIVPYQGSVMICCWLWNQASERGNFSGYQSICLVLGGAIWDQIQKRDDPFSLSAALVKFLSLPEIQYRESTYKGKISGQKLKKKVLIPIYDRRVIRLSRCHSSGHREQGDRVAHYRRLHYCPHCGRFNRIDSIKITRKCYRCNEYVGPIPIWIERKSWIPAYEVEDRPKKVREARSVDPSWDVGNPDTLPPQK